MSVIKKVITLMRSSVRDIGESVVDANASLIYEQEILDAKRSIMDAKHELTGVMAQEMQSARSIEQLQNDIQRYESLAVEALNKHQDDLAMEVAAKVSALDLELQDQSRAHAACAVQVARLKDLIKTAEARVREHERELGIAKTTESVYRATRSISDNIDQGGSRLVSARESLERIKKRHQTLADRMTAAEQLNKEFSDAALADKLAAAGVGDDAQRQQAAMERIRARRQNESQGQP